MSGQLLPEEVRGIRRGKYEAADTVPPVEEVQGRMVQCPTLLAICQIMIPYAQGKVMTCLYPDTASTSP